MRTCIVYVAYAGLRAKLQRNVSSWSNFARFAIGTETSDDRPETRSTVSGVRMFMEHSTTSTCYNVDVVYLYNVRREVCVLPVFKTYHGYLPGPSLRHGFTHPSFSCRILARSHPRVSATALPLAFTRAAAGIAFFVFATGTATPTSSKSEGGAAR